MYAEEKIFKSGNGQVISLKKKHMVEMGFQIGDTLVFTKIDDDIVLTKKPEKSFDEEWNEFFENGGTYDDKESYDWGKPVGREVW